jgi:hypothetical protein
MGTAYDEERGLAVYDGKGHFAQVREFFGQRCCYCGDELVSGRVAQDHLVPMNKTSLGLHAWGNVVPAHYRYAPDLTDLRDTAEELYAEVGVIAMSLITMKVKRVRDRL